MTSYLGCLCADQIETSISSPHRAKPGPLKIGSFKFPPPRAKMACYPIVGFVCPMLLPMNNRRRFLSSLLKLAYIRGKRRHSFTMESYFGRWLGGTLYSDFQNSYSLNSCRLFQIL